MLAQESSARLSTSAGAAGAIGEQVTLLTAQSAAQLEAAKTLKIYGEALSTMAQGLDDMSKLKIEYVRDYWERKSVRFEESIRTVEQQTVLNRIPMLEQRRRTLILWERTFTDLETTQYSAHSGRSLNMILDQLNRETTLSYAPSPPSGIGLQGGDTFRLSDELLAAIRIQVKLVGGPTVISLSDTLPARFDWWPYSLREAEFAQLRNDLTSSREQVAAQVATGRGIEHELLKRMESEMEQLVSAFYTKYPAATWKHQDAKQMKRLFAAEAFLKQSDREVARLVEIGDGAAAAFPNFLKSNPERTVTTLCHWMLSHGLRFAPAAIGDEPTYTKLFGILRQYALAADVSPSMEWVEAALERPELLRNVKESDIE